MAIFVRYTRNFYHIVTLENGNNFGASTNIRQIFHAVVSGVLRSSRLLFRNFTKFESSTANVKAHNRNITMQMAIVD